MSRYLIENAPWSHRPVEPRDRVMFSAFGYTHVVVDRHDHARIMCWDEDTAREVAESRNIAAAIDIMEEP